MEFDPNTIVEAIETVSRGANASRKIADTVKIFQGLFKETESPDMKKVELIFSELTKEIANSNHANAHLTLTLTKLQEEITNLKNHATDMDRYHLYETSTGDIVLKLKDDDESGEPMHYLCHKCSTENRKSILHGNQFIRRCHTCDVQYKFQNRPQQISGRTTGGW